MCAPKKGATGADGGLCRAWPLRGAEGGVPAWLMGLAGQLCVLGLEPCFGALSAHSRIWHFFGLALGSFAGV